MPPVSDRGELCLVLHSHMPYVEGFGTWPFGEEWLHEAIATSYLPLIDLLERQHERAGGPIVTVGITPVLSDQLAMPGVGERFLRFMHETRRECHRLDIAGMEEAGRGDAADALRGSARDYEWAADEYERRDGDLLGALRRLRDTGAIELWTSTATHAVLPLLATEQGTQLQLGAGVAAHRARFGAWSGGLWLPECAYRPGLDEQLGAAGVRVFCVDQSRAGDPLDQLEPRATPAGPLAVPIDWDTITLVWHEDGYPADPVYRDYHVPTMNGMRPFAISGEAYDPNAARARAREHARDFIGQVIRRAEAYRMARGRPALVVCALDTELLGHWWYEGPTWLEAVLEEARGAGLALGTLPDALERHPPTDKPLAEASWGVGKDLRTWDSPAVAEIVWPAREAEVRLVAALAEAGAPDGARAAGERAARELLALQSSDWAFMVTRDLAADYPQRRVRSHAAEFDRALGVLRGAMKDSRAMPGGSPTDPSLRGLAPSLDLAPLLAPSSPWGRSS
jgi:1,4-alpha-glucan branching enzyme